MIDEGTSTVNFMGIAGCIKPMQASWVYLAATAAAKVMMARTDFMLMNWLGCFASYNFGLAKKTKMIIMS
jgi:hypothetical protein